jgi:hypothetical protein
MSKEFTEWYAYQFDEHPGANEYHNVQLVKTIWNAALELAAKEFDFNNFDMLTAEQAAKILRGHKV